MVHVLVTVGDHRAPTVPPPSSDNVHRCRRERVCGPHHRTDVEVPAPVLDRDVERVAASVQIGHDRLQAPVPVAVDDVAPVSLRQQFGIQTWVLGPILPLTGPRADADLLLGSLGAGGLWGHHRSIITASATSSCPGYPTATAARRRLGPGGRPAVADQATTHDTTEGG